MSGNESMPAKGKIDATSTESAVQAVKKDNTIVTDVALVKKSSENSGNPIIKVEHPLEMNPEDDSLDLTVSVTFKVPNRQVSIDQQLKNHLKEGAKVAINRPMFAFNNKEKVKRKPNGDIPKISVAPIFGSMKPSQTQKKITLQPLKLERMPSFLSQNKAFSPSKWNTSTGISNLISGSPSKSPLKISDRNNNNIQLKETFISKLRSSSPTILVEHKNNEPIEAVVNKENVVSDERYPMSMYISPFHPPRRRPIRRVVAGLKKHSLATKISRKS